MCFSGSLGCLVLISEHGWASSEKANFLVSQPLLLQRTYTSPWGHILDRRLWDLCFESVNAAVWYLGVHVLGAFAVLHEIYICCLEPP